MERTSLRVVLLALLVQGFLGGLAPLGGQTPPVAATTLRYVVFPAPPFMIGADSEQDELTGIDVTLVKEIARRMNLKVAIVRAPWARALNLMATGKADLLSSAFKTPEREQYMDYFAEPFLTTLPIAFYTWKGSGIQVGKYEDLGKVKSIGVLRGASYFERFDNDKALSKVEFASQDQLMPMLASRRLDLMAGYIDTENYRLTEEGYSGKVEKTGLQYDNPVAVYMALSRQSPLLPRKAEFDAINHQLLAEGFVKKTVNRFRNPAP
ncbi:MAG: transporter substrate-binding domain-containing protein [Spirochaetales bacterium]